MFFRFSNAFSVPKFTVCFASKIELIMQAFAVTCLKHSAELQRQLFNALYPTNLNYIYFSCTIGIFFAKSKSKPKKCLKLELFCMNVRMLTLN